MMKVPFDGFDLLHIPEWELVGRCRQCGSDLVSVTNGWFSKALFCPQCEIAYVPKLVKVSDKKMTEEWLKQAREQVSKKKVR